MPKGISKKNEKKLKKYLAKIKKNDVKPSCKPAAKFIK